MKLPDWLGDEYGRVERLIERDELPHALLIHGPAGTGRRWLALALADRLLGLSGEVAAAALTPGELIDEEIAPTHPDFVLVQPPPDKRALPIDLVRRLIETLHLTSHQSGYKVALVHPAHAMSIGAANSLLKTLEEPPGRTLIVLVTDSLSRLTPTIVSRCHRVRVSLPAAATGLRWLGAQDSKVDWQGLLDLAGGAPLQALEYHGANAVAHIAEFEQDVAALERRQASPTGVAGRWVKRDPGLCMAWMYRRIAAEIRSNQCATAGRTGENQRPSHLKNGAENPNIERAFAELRAVGELRRLQGSGLNPELQLAGLLTRWYGRRAAG